MKISPSNKFLFYLFVFFVTLSVSGQVNDANIVVQWLDWAPDGKGMVFTVIKVKPDWSDYSPDKWKLLHYDFHQNKLTELDSGCLYFDISNDGKWIVYDKVDDNNRNIFLMDLNTKESRPLIEHEAKDGGPSFSPYGDMIVFYSDREGKDELYVHNIKERTTHKISEEETHKSYNPVWSPEQDEIVYFLEKGDKMDQIYLTDVEGSFHRNLTNDDHHNIFPSWTPAGDIIYLRDKGEVMIMDTKGEHKRPLVSQTASQVKMGPDGHFLMISEKSIIQINLDSGDITEVLDLKGIF